MQQFKTFFKVGVKHLPALSIYYIIFAVLTFLLGSSSQSNIDQNFQMKSLDICIIDEDNSTASRELTSYLGSIHNLVKLENDPEVLQDYIYYRYISYILTIPEGFEEKLSAGDTDGLLTNVKVPGSSSGYFVDQQVSQFIQAVTLYEFGGSSLEDALAKAKETLAGNDVVESITFQNEIGGSQKEVYYFYQYLPYIFIALLLCGLSPILITFRKTEINARTNCSSLRPEKRSLQLALACVVYSIFIWASFLLLGFLAYGKSMLTGNALLAMANSLVFLLFATALALFISTFDPTFDVINMIANVVGIGMSFLCGVFVPQSMLSDTVLRIGRFLPAYWYVRANNMLAGFSADLMSMNLWWKSVGIQLLFAAAFFSLTLLAGTKRRRT